MTQKEAIHVTANYGHYAGRFLVSDRGNTIVSLLHATYKPFPVEGGLEYMPVFITGFTENKDELYLPINDVIELVENRHTHYIIP